MSRALKCELGAFAVIWFASMLYEGQQVYDSLPTHGNVFLYCLLTVVEMAINCAFFTGIHWFIYFIFQHMGGKLGRFISIALTTFNLFLLPRILHRQWPARNRDPVGTEVVFVLLAAAAILLLLMAYDFKNGPSDPLFDP